MARDNNGTTDQGLPQDEQPGGVVPPRLARPQRRRPDKLPEAAARTPSVQPATGRATGKAAGTSRAEAIGDVILPAITRKGLREQLQQMWDELGTGMFGLNPTRFKDRWNDVFERNQQALTGRGLKPTPERAKAFARFTAEATAGRDPGAPDFKKQLRKELPTRPDQRTINRWLQEWKKEHG